MDLGHDEFWLDAEPNQALLRGRRKEAF